MTDTDLSETIDDVYQGQVLPKPDDERWSPEDREALTWFYAMPILDRMLFIYDAYLGYMEAEKVDEDD